MQRAGTGFRRQKAAVLILMGIVLVGLITVAMAKVLPTHEAIVQRALSTAKTISDPEERISAYLYIAEKLETFGDDTGATQTREQAVKDAEKFADAPLRVRTLLSILSELDCVRDHVAARDIAHLAVAAATTIDDASGRFESLDSILQMLCAVDDRSMSKAVTRLAMAAADSIKYLDDRDIALQTSTVLWAHYGNISDALAMARTMQKTSRRRAAALAGIAAQQALAADRLEAATTLQEARLNAEQIEDNYWRNSTLSEIALVLAKDLQDFSGAIAIVKTMDDAGERSRALAYLAAMQDRGNGHAAAVATVQMALRAAKSIENAEDQASALALVAEILIENAPTPDLNGALSVARRIEIASIRDSSLARVVVALVEADRIREALALIDEMQVGGRIEALASIARAQLLKGDKVGAEASIRLARRDAEQASDRGDRDRGLATIAAVQAHGNPRSTDFFDALTVALNFMGSRDFLPTETFDGKPAPDSAEILAAVETARAINDPGIRLDALAYVATPLIEAGNRKLLRIPIHEAFATLETISNNDAEAHELEYLLMVGVHSVAGDAIGALESARRLPVPDARSMALIFVAWGRACGGDSEGARLTLSQALHELRKIEDKETRDELFAMAAIVQARLPDLVDALATSDHITDPSVRSSVLIRIATDLSLFDWITVESPPYR